MRIPIIPSWCKGLPDKTILYSNDIMEFFGYNENHPTGHVFQYIIDGALPEPLKLKLKCRGSKRARKVYWTLGGIRQLRMEMLNEQTNQKD